MSDDDVKTPDAAPAPALEDPTAPSSPAVQSDQVWGGPRWIHNATGEPVWIETKEQYWALLDRFGLRMKDQAESTTGPAQPKEAEPIPVHLTPSPPVPPISMEEAHIYGAITAVHKRYGLVESVWCDHCFARNRWHACRVRVTSREVTIECRCGVAAYRAPTGATDLVLSKVTTSAITMNDTTVGTVVTAAGPEFRPTTFFQDMEAVLIRRYISALRMRGKEPRLFHIGCWNRDVTNEDDAIGISYQPDKLIYICKCRTLIHVERGALVN
jgi:hypothetical protein